MCWGAMCTAASPTAHRTKVHIAWVGLTPLGEGREIKEIREEDRKGEGGREERGKKEVEREGGEEAKTDQKGRTTQK